MRRILLTATAAASLAACADGTEPLAPSLSVDETAEIAASSAEQVETAGSFLAQVDFTTISFTPRGENCLLTVDGRLVFSGTIEGIATGTTEALVFAPCSEASTTPPGTYRDVFKSELEFTGTIAGEPVSASLLYMGSVEGGGGEAGSTIDGRLIFSNGVSGRLEADAIVAVGGTYSGKLVVH